MLLSSNKVLNKHHFSPANRQADEKTELNSETVSADILSLLAR